MYRWEDLQPRELMRRDAEQRRKERQDRLKPEDGDIKPLIRAGRKLNEQWRREDWK